MINNKLQAKLPPEIAGAIDKLPESLQRDLEEIRIRESREILIYAGGKEYTIPVKPNKEKLNNIYNHILNYSVYAYQEELANGYVTIEGGHRVGVCGRTVIEGGKVKGLRDISSLNIRRSREIPGISEPFLKHLLDSNGSFYNTIIVSPPKCGKTTLLRDLIRNLSNRGFKVSVCDERSEIAGCDHGVISFDLGKRTDVLDSCPKEKGMIMLIRSMAPDILATDEIGKPEDCYAVESAVCAGIGLLTTIHGNNFEDLKRSGIGALVNKGIFQRILYLSTRPKTGTVTRITDWKNQDIWRAASC